MYCKFIKKYLKSQSAEIFITFHEQHFIDLILSIENGSNKNNICINIVQNHNCVFSKQESINLSKADSCVKNIHLRLINKFKPRKLWFILLINIFPHGITIFWN